MDLKTKIIATIGPSTLKYETLQKLIDEGIDFIRINTAYGNFEQYDLILNNLQLSKKIKPVEVIFDIKNIDILTYAKEHSVKFIALSFTESSEQISNVKKVLPEAFVISKIESVKGVKNFNAILEKSDGIMVARGDLGEAVSLERVPPLQKEFTIKTLKMRKFLVTATEMLLSMVNKSEPTRAEVSDVANAVFDYSSAVMLSEETAIGNFPVETVIYMRKIIVEAEKYLKQV